MVPYLRRLRSITATLIAATLVSGVLAVTLAAGAFAQDQGGGQVGGIGALRATVDGFLAGAAAGDHKSIDAAVCMESLAASALARAADLGLVADPTGGATIARYQNDYRDAVAAAFAGVDGGDVVAIDTDDIHRISGENAGSEGAEIDAGGIVRLVVHGRDGPIDIPAHRAGGVWCLNPVSVQP